METITYHPNEIDELFAQRKDLKGVIEKIEKDLYNNGKVLCGIRVNGMSLSPDDELRFEKSRRNEIEILEISTESVGDLIIESRESLKKYLRQMKEVSLKASDALRAGVTRETNDLIRAIVDGSTWVTDMLSQIKSLDGGYPKIQKAWIAAEKEFLRVSAELLAAFEQNDTVLLADSLEYEWAASIDQWLSVLSLLDQPSSKG